MTMGPRCLCSIQTAVSIRNKWLGPSLEISRHYGKYLGLLKNYQVIILQEFFFIAVRIGQGISINSGTV